MSLVHFNGQNKFEFRVLSNKLIFFKRSVNQSELYLGSILSNSIRINTRAGV